MCDSGQTDCASETHGNSKCAFPHKPGCLVSQNGRTIHTGLVLPSLLNPFPYLILLKLHVYSVRWEAVFPSYKGGWAICRMMWSPAQSFTARKGADPGFASYPASIISAWASQPGVLTQLF